MRALKLQFFRKSKLSFGYIFNSFHVVLRLKRSETSHQLENGDSKCPEINHFIISTSLEHFWSSVVRSSCQRQHLPFPSSFLYFLTDSKINEFNMSIFFIIKNIIRFDISVTDFIHVDILQCSQQLEGYQL